MKKGVRLVIIQYGSGMDAKLKTVASMCLLPFMIG